MSTPLLDGIRKQASASFVIDTDMLASGESLLDAIKLNPWSHPIEEAEKDAISLKRDPSNPFSLFEDKDPGQTRRATEEMRGMATKFMSDTHDWAKRNQKIGAGDTAVFDKLTQYMNANMRLGWEEIFKKKASLLDGIRKIARDASVKKLSSSILSAISSLAKDEWYGFKVDKNNYDTPIMRVFSPIGEASYIVPVPSTLAKAGKSIDWMTLPRDNIDGTAKTDTEKAIIDYWDSMIWEPPKEEQASRPALDSIRKTAAKESFKKKYGITHTEKTEPEHCVHSIGFSPKTNEWYGWSHRAIAGFGIGSKVALGNSAFLPSNKEEFLKETESLWEKKTNDFEVLPSGVNVISKKSKLSHIEKYPKKWGKGEWTAKTIEDAKQMATDFAKSVS